MDPLLSIARAWGNALFLRALETREGGATAMVEDIPDARDAGCPEPPC